MPGNIKDASAKSILWRSIFALFALLAPSAQAHGDAWTPVEQLSLVLQSWEGKLVGGESRNPFTDLTAEGVRNRWLRFSGDVDQPESGMQFLLTVFEGDRVSTRSPPSQCVTRNFDGVHCVGLLWVPPEATRIRLVVWASQSAGHIHNVQLQTAGAASPDAQLDGRLLSILQVVEKHYYRSADVDWPSLRRKFDGIGFPPADTDPLPSLVQLLRDRLPDNRHTFVRPTSAIGTPAKVQVPTCRQVAQLTWLLHLPSATYVDAAPVARYVEAARACIAKVPREATWVIDLRENEGGNMQPMLAALDEFFSEGQLLTFLNGRGETIDTVSLSTSGLVQGGQLVLPFAASPGRRGDARIAVLIGPACASSCEVVATAFHGRAHTEFVGAPTAGLMTGNVMHPINHDYILILTESYFGDRCGARMPERIRPDVYAESGAEALAVARLVKEQATPVRNLPCRSDS
jgi:hypothetical protein